MRLLKSILPLLLVTAFYFPVQAQKQKTDSLLEVLKKDMPDTQRVTTLVNISNSYRDIDDKKAAEYAQQAIDLGKEIDYPKGLAAAYSSYGIALGDMGKMDDEMAYHEKSFQISKSIGDKKNMAKSRSNLAIDEYTLGSYKDAVAHCLEAIGYFTEINDNWGVAIVDMTLGNISVDQKHYSEALKYYNDALEKNHMTEKNEMFDARIYGNIGNVYNGQEQYDTCLAYYHRALAVFEKYGLQKEKSVMLNNIGTVLKEQGKAEEALVYLRQSLAIRIALGDSDGVCSAYQNIGSSLSKLGKVDSAIYYYSEALRMALNMHSKSQEASSYMALAEGNSMAGKFEVAYKYLDKYVQLNDSLLGSESEDEINNLKSRFKDAQQARKDEQEAADRQLEKERSTRNLILVLLILVGVSLIAVILFTRIRHKQRINEQLERKNLEITLHQTAINDSINYAKKIQDSILPPDSLVKKILPDSFVLYLPKDVVSGDFYWMEQRDGKAVFAAVDCTGHGVPGALMSVVGFNLLNQAVNEMGLTKPSDILHHLDYGVNKLLRQSDEGSSVKDGMDLALCTLDPVTRHLQYAGVFNPAYIVHNGNLEQLKADKFPIGINPDGVTDNYTNTEKQLERGDMIYLFSDGYADQFGGPSGKKFMYRRFRELLVSIHSLPTETQKQKLADAFHEWRGNHEQVDDIIVIGVRV